MLITQGWRSETDAVLWCFAYKHFFYLSLRYKILHYLFIWTCRALVTAHRCYIYGCRKHLISFPSWSFKTPLDPSNLKLRVARSELQRRVYRSPGRLPSQDSSRG